MKNVLLPLHVAGLAMAVHPWLSYEQQPIILSFTHHSEFIGYMSAPMLLINFLDNQACTSVASSNIRAAMEAQCQASVTSAQVVLISKLTMQGSAG